MYLISCFKRLLRSPMFWLSAIGTAAICMFSELYVTAHGESKTVIEMFMQYSKKAMLSDAKLCSYNVFVTGLRGWLKLFVPVIVSISAVGICTDERKSGMWRLTLHRTGRIRYSIDSGLFILLSGGLVLTLGSGIFAAYAAIMFPSLSAYSAENVNSFTEIMFRHETAMYSIYKAGGLVLCTAAQLAETFFYGMVWSAAAMLLTVFSENKYVTICIPFFLKYALDQFSTSLFIKAADDPAGYNEKLLNLAELIGSDAASSFLNYPKDLIGRIVLINAGFVVTLFVLSCIIRIRRLKNET